MNRKIITGISLLLILVSLFAISCAKDNTKGITATDVPNGSFEETNGSKWVGWTKEDAAFSARCVTSDEKVHGILIEKDGNNWLSGTKGANPPMRGTLTSEPFKLGGTGFITFKLGAGKDNDKCYVEFLEYGTDKVLAKVANKNCDGLFITDHLITQVVDLSAYKGKAIYVRITDNDDGNDYSYINADGFRTLMSQSEIDAAKAAYEREIEAYGEKPFEEDEKSASIVNGGFETGDLTGWKTLSGNALTVAGITATDETYWGDRYVYGEGQWYLSSVGNESNVGAIRSTKFTLSGDGYITFLIGAAPRNCYVALCDGATDEELIVIGNNYFSDPALALTLLRVYVDASRYLGRVCYIKIVDNADGTTGGFAFINIDDIRVSLTKDEVADLEVEQLESVTAETRNSASYDDLATLKNYYTNYPYPVALRSLTMTSYVEHKTAESGVTDITAYLSEARASFGDREITDFTLLSVERDGEAVTGDFSALALEDGFYSVTYGATYGGKSTEAVFTIVVNSDETKVANGGFESGNLAGWTVLTPAWSVVEGHATGVIAASSYWGEELPYNNEGTYHLNGWNNGIGESEGWSVRSSLFTLSGSGWITVRMGGAAAAVKIFKEDGTLVGHFRQSRFNDSGFPHVGMGGSWADMATYALDMSAFKGERLYIELNDEIISGGWAHGFFDAVETYWEEAPAWETMADTVMDGHTGGESASVIEIPWQLGRNLVK